MEAVWYKNEQINEKQNGSNGQYYSRIGQCFSLKINTMFKLIKQIYLLLEILVQRIKSNLVVGEVIHEFTEVSLFVQRI